MNRVVVVDANDTVVGLKPYTELGYGDIYRVSVLWLTDKTSGDFLLTQRKWSKHNDPGKWMAAASGTIEENESYDQNIIHEIREEIGLEDLELQQGPKEFIDDGKHRFFTQWYLAEVDKTKVIITIQASEVETYAWISRQQLLKELQTTPDKFVPSMKQSLKMLGIF